MINIASAAPIAIMAYTQFGVASSAGGISTNGSGTVVAGSSVVLVSARMQPVISDIEVIMGVSIRSSLLIIFESID